MVSKILVGIRKAFRTETALQKKIGELNCSELGEPIQGAFYSPNLISILEGLPWVGKHKLTPTLPQPGLQSLSVRQLNGVYFGKTPHGISFNTFLDYSYKLKPVAEYSLRDRIGYESENDFEANCAYIRENETWITGSDEHRYHVTYREWDQKRYLFNRDGAHHFAAVYRQCIEQNRDFVFECFVQREHLNRDACRELLGQAHFLLVLTNCAEQLAQVFQWYTGVPVISYREYQSGKTLIFFNRLDATSDDWYNLLLRTLPPQTYFDLSSWLSRLIRISPRSR